MESERLEEIKKRLSSNAYFLHPLSDANVREDIGYLLDLLKQREDHIEQLEKKIDVVTLHNMELLQEMENIKSDFGNSR